MTPIDEPMRLTVEEIAAVLQQWWDDTGTWDPWLNGTMEKELEGLDPDTPEQLEKRKAIVDRYKWDHDIYTGQRMATSGLKSRFRQMEKDRRVDYVDSLPWEGLRPCCVEYIAALDHESEGYRRVLRGEEEAFFLDAPLEEVQASYEKMLADTLALREQITTGAYTVADKRQCCPWDDRLNDDPFLSSYRTLTKFFNAGGTVDDLTLGPIEMVPDKYR